MNRTGLTMVISLIILVAVATIPIMVIQDAFARYQRHTGGDLSQAASVSNSCLNPVSNSNTNDNMISNGNCGGTISQQGKSGQASTPTTVQNANPNIEVQRATTTTTPTAQEPSPTPGKALLSISLQCLAESCPPVDPSDLSFAVSANIVSPTEFHPSSPVTISFSTSSTSTFEVQLTSEFIGFVEKVSTNAPCSQASEPKSITGPIPQPGQTISCNIEVTFIGA